MTSAQISSWALSAAATDTGLIRDHNEDRVFLQPWHDGQALLAVVADGMGGHRGGEVAAEIAIAALAELLNTPLPADHAERYQLLTEGLQEANRRVVTQANQSFKLLGMGATVVAAIVTPTSYLYLHAGDCRFYHFRANGEPVRRSKDHTVMQVLLDLGEISEADIPHHPMRSVVNSCLGGHSDKPVAFDPRWSEDNPPIYPWEAGDVLLLSSDGIHGAIALSLWPNR
ncbi:MAG: serine/threonine-protein phosphatase [Oscillatoriales cyanobacterium SM2_1_8]|nr:serine/threonine-protein phosphatase [Oscillatoriales cyanobacterium SM2_1_8]